MIETHIKILASFYTALLITAVVSLLLFGGFKIKIPATKGKVISATMIDISQLTKLTSKKKTPIKKQKPVVKPQPIPQPKQPEKKPVKKVKQQVKPVKKIKPLIPKKIKPKVDTKAQEREKQKRIERQKKLTEIRKKRKAAEQRRKIEENKLKEISDKKKKETQEQVTQTSGISKGQSEKDKLNELMSRYQQAVVSAVQRQWNKPVSANKNLLCHVKVRQIPGGGVIDATIASPCNANAIVKKSILAAIQKADPLPFKGFEKVFDRTATFIFQPEN